MSTLFTFQLCKYHTLKAINLDVWNTKKERKFVFFYSLFVFMYSRTLFERASINKRKISQQSEPENYSTIQHLHKSAFSKCIFTETQISQLSIFSRRSFLDGVTYTGGLPDGRTTDVEINTWRRRAVNHNDVTEQAIE